MLCNYGCGLEAKFVVTAKNKPCCSEAYRQCPAVKQKNKDGCKKAVAEGRKGYTYNPKSATGKTPIPHNDVFIEGSTQSTEYVKARILKDQLMDYKCSCCGLVEWQSKPIVLALDHINGVGNDNRIDNLRFFVS